MGAQDLVEFFFFSFLFFYFFFSFGRVYFEEVCGFDFCLKEI